MDIKVSVIIPTFNRAHTLGETLDSVVAQSFTNWECIVVDDGSSDGTDELMRRYIEKDSRFQYHVRPISKPKGGCVCRNIGLGYAKGDFIQFLDSDDLISSNKFEEQVNALVNNDSNAIATCKWDYFTTSNNVLSAKLSRPTYITTDPLTLLNIFGNHSTYLPQHVYLVRKKVIDNAGYWNEQLTVNQDGEFYTRLLSHCSKVVFVPTAEVYYRTDAGNNTSAWSDEDKIRKLIFSWRLIDSIIEEKFNISNHTYVKRARNGILKKIEKKYPKIVKDNQDFFELRRSRLEHFFIKVRSKIQLLYLVNVKDRF